VPLAWSAQNTYCKFVSTARPVGKPPLKKAVGSEPSALARHTLPSSLVFPVVKYRYEEVVVGEEVGTIEGISEGNGVGPVVGAGVGTMVGNAEGAGEGVWLGECVG
jgi:hypothetical protein